MWMSELNDDKPDPPDPPEASARSARETASVSADDVLDDYERPSEAQDDAVESEPGTPNVSQAEVTSDPDSHDHDTTNSELWTRVELLISLRSPTRPRRRSTTSIEPESIRRDTSVGLTSITTDAAAVKCCLDMTLTERRSPTGNGTSIPIKTELTAHLIEL